MPNGNLIDRAIEWFAPIKGAQRRSARMALEASYQGSISTRISTGYTPSVGMVGRNHALARWRLTKMRDRARDLERNNVLAAGLLDRATENVIGTGMKVQARTADPAFNKTVEKLFSDWFETADVRGLFGGADLQRIIYRSMLRDGDVGVVMVGSDDPTYAGLQVVEGNDIDSPYGTSPDSNTVDGITFNDAMRPIRFSVVRRDAMGKQTGFPVEARDFVYLWRTKMASGLRGEPCFAQTFDLFDQIEGYKEAVIVAARVIACQAMLIKSMNAPNAFNGLQSQTGADGLSQRIKKIEPGGVHYLNPGEDVVQPNPTQPSQNFSDFIATIVRFVGISVGLPLEVLLLDFSRTNYSSARAALLQLQRACRPQQQQFINRFLSRVYQWRLAKFVKSGELIVPAALRDTYWNHQWIAPGWPWVDPVKDLQAALMAKDANLDTLANIAMQHGGEISDIFAGRKREQDQIEELGLPDVRSSMTRDPMSPTNPSPGKPAQTPPTDEEDDEELSNE